MSGTTIEIVDNTWPALQRAEDIFGPPRRRVPRRSSCATHDSRARARAHEAEACANVRTSGALRRAVRSRPPS